MIDLVVEALTLNLQYTSSLYIQPAGLDATAARRGRRRSSLRRRAAECNAWLGLKEA